MADVKKYYYLKLKDNFFDSQEVRILESMPNGVYYSNMLIKLYLKALRNDGALKLNDYKSFDENMIAALTNLDIEIVRKGLEELAALNLIEKLEDGTIYMSNMQSFIGKSTSEADRKRLYRDKIEEEKLLLKQNNETFQNETTKDCSANEWTTMDKCPPDNRDKEIRDLENIDKETKDSLSVDILRDFENRTGIIGSLNLGALKKAVQLHGIDNVKKAIDKALERNKPTMVYINGILKNWAKEGYPKEGEQNGNGSTGKDNESTANEFAIFRAKEPRTLSEQERSLVEAELL